MATQTAPPPPGPPVAVLGQGRAGRDLCRLLQEARIEIGLAWARPAPLPRPIPAGIVFLAVPDAAIGALAAELAAPGALRPGTALVHLSGALDAAVLRARGDLPVASAHPLQTLVGDGRVARPFPWLLEGDSQVVAPLRAIVAAMGCTAVELAPEGKTRYHAAATITSNLLVALADLASGQAARAGVPAEELPALFAPLMHATVEHLVTHGAAGALTGPIARGDLDTIAAHLDALADSPADRDVYRLLSLRLVSLAEDRGLDPGRALALRSLLRLRPAQR